MKVNGDHEGVVTKAIPHGGESSFGGLTFHSDVGGGCDALSLENGHWSLDQDSCYHKDDEYRYEETAFVGVIVVVTDSPELSVGE